MYKSRTSEPFDFYYMNTIFAFTNISYFSDKCEFIL